MLIDPSESDDSVSTKPDGEDNDALIVDDNSIQTGWNTIVRDSSKNSADSGILIVPSVLHEISVDGEPNELAFQLQSNASNNNFSLPSSVPSSVPTILPEAFTNVMRNLSTSEDVSELPESMSGNHSQSRCSLNEEENYVIGVGRRFVSRNANCLVLLTVLLTAVLSLSTVFYLLSERNAWLATTIRLEESVRKLEDSTDIRLLKEQEKARAQEAAALQEKRNLASQLQEVTAKLKAESEARSLEKKKAESLERDVLSLRREITSLDKESQRAKDLEQEVLRLQKIATEQEKERLKAAKLEGELSRLQSELTKKSKSGHKQASCSADKKENQIPFESESSEAGSVKFLDNCWLQTEVKMGLGECARNARESVSQQILGWGETVSKAQDRMAQDYNDVKEMFRTMSSDAKKETFDEKVKESPKQEKHDKPPKESLNKLWKDLGETLSNAQGRVMDQMAQDYGDLKAWYNDISSGLLFQSNGADDAANAESSAKHQSEAKPDSKRAYKTGKVYGGEAKKVSEETKGERSSFDSVKDTAKTILYSAAVASLATVAADVAGKWMNSFSGEEEPES